MLQLREMLESVFIEAGLEKLHIQRNERSGQLHIATECGRQVMIIK